MKLDYNDGRHWFLKGLFAAVMIGAFFIFPVWTAVWADAVVLLFSAGIGDVIENI